MKNSFLIYTDYLEHIELLTMEQRGVLLTAIMYYSTGSDLPEMDGMTKMAFSFIKSQMDRDTTRYEKTVEARSQAGRKGGRPKSEKANAFSEKQEKAKKANAFSEKQMKAKKPDNDNVTVTDNDNEKEKDNGINAVCPEANKFSPAPVIEIVLNDGSNYQVSETDYAYYMQLYPAVDIMSELRKMAGWCYSNAKNRKTRRGIQRFINSWLSREQDRCKSPVAENKSPAQTKTNKFNNFQQRNYDFSSLEAKLLGGDNSGRKTE